MKKKRELIISEARKLIKQFGVKKTSIEDIARASGMAKASIYHYFSGKDEICKEVIVREIASIRRKCMISMDSKVTLEEKLIVYMENRMKQYVNLLNSYLYFSSEYYWSHGIIEQLREEFSKAEEAMISSLLDENGHQVEVLTKLIQSLIAGYEVKVIQGQPMKEFTEELEMQISYILKGCN